MQRKSSSFIVVCRTRTICPHSRYCGANATSNLNDPRLFWPDAQSRNQIETGHLHAFPASRRIGAGKFAENRNAGIKIKTAIMQVERPVDGLRRAGAPMTARQIAETLIAGKAPQDSGQPSSKRSKGTTTATETISTSLFNLCRSTKTVGPPDECQSNEPGRAIEIVAVGTVVGQFRTAREDWTIARTQGSATKLAR